MKFTDMLKFGIPSVKNDMNEVKRTYQKADGLSIVFPNGFIASVIKRKNDDYSVAVCDYNGYFNWDILRPFGTNDGTIECKTEEETCEAIEIIRHLNSKIASVLEPCGMCGKMVVPTELKEYNGHCYCASCYDDALDEEFYQKFGRYPGELK